MEAETIELAQARHRKELKELQGRITSKKKNATKKTRKGVNDECAEMERLLKAKQEQEIAVLNGALGPEGPEGETEDTAAAPSTTGEQNETDDILAQKTEAISFAEKETETAASIQKPEKKRNRQQERLARRAAEQEAAAAQAEQEAAGMTDHRALESEYMKTMFEKNGLVEKDIDPDGHCLFSAVADQLLQYDIPISDVASTNSSLPNYKLVRKAAATYMSANADDFAPFLEEDLDDYVAKMRDTAEWGGELELTALARHYGVGISVVQDGRTEKIGEGDKILWLAYYRHGYGLGEHYNSLRKT